MKTKAAVLFAPGEDWQVIELELDPPKAGEVLLRVEYCGLCHSDEHVRKGAFLRYPVVGGHEGAGIIEQVGPGVTSVAPGDHAVTSFAPRCGNCPSCMSGRSFLCDFGAAASSGEFLDGTFRLHHGTTDVGAMCMLGTFSQWVVVPEGSVVKVDNDLPLDVASLLACGVPTGWGSAVNVAQVRPGEVVVIYGTGGVGMNAVQGAALAGARTIVAVDPVEWKLERAKAFGAHQGFTTHEDAMAFLVDHTQGTLADKAIVVIGNVESGVVANAVDAVSKFGTVVLTGMSDPTEVPTIQLNGTFMAVYAKRLLTTLYGNCNPHVDIPRLAKLYRTGQLKLDELITARYSLEDVNKGYHDLLAGQNLRGIIEFEH